MDVTLRIPDTLADRYAAYGPSLESALLAQLLRFAAIGPADRAIIVSHEDRARIESILGITVQRSDQLRERVERLARLRVGEIEIPFSAQEWQEIRLRADKRGITPEDECRRIVRAMHDSFFNY